MDEPAAINTFDAEVEILPPHHFNENETTACVCCLRLRPRTLMDEDGCGICNECLAP